MSPTPILVAALASSCRVLLKNLDTGAVIYTTYGGVLDLGPDGYNQFAQGNLPPRVNLRIAPRYYTSHPDYLWLNRLQCVGIGQFDRDRLRVDYEIFALR